MAAGMAPSWPSGVTPTTVAAIGRCWKICTTGFTARSGSPNCRWNASLMITAGASAAASASVNQRPAAKFTRRISP